MFFFSRSSFWGLSNPNMKRYQRIRRFVLVGWCIGLSCFVSGCANSPLRDSFVLGWLPERGDDIADLQRYGPIPAQEIVQLKKLAEAASQASLEVQQRLSADLLERVQNEADTEVRAAVVEALASCNTALAMQGLREAAADAETDVRIAACEALGRRGDADSVSLMAQVLGSDTDMDVRLAAARSLAGIDSPTALRALGTALDDQSPALQYRVIQSLRSVSPHDYGGDLGAWRQFAQGGTPPVPETPVFAQRFRRWF
ncbi:MAG: hypothetical protein CMJ62_02175 [Planctomycetaceae bacterium]|nr:hypothetical protein [Planctomycetaceae bacterium]